MPALRPIIYDYIEDGRPSPEDQARVALRERATGATPPQLPTRRNRLGGALAGYRLAGGGRIRGGKFTPRATSGMTPAS